jgi:hypothetical protein
MWVTKISEKRLLMHGITPRAQDEKEIPISTRQLAYIASPLPTPDPLVV